MNASLTRFSVQAPANGTVTRNCDNCTKPYEADSRNLARGWGKCCSKACAASKREKSKLGYDPARVERNNFRRENWNAGRMDHDYSDDPREWDGHKVYTTGF